MTISNPGTSFILIDRVTNYDTLTLNTRYEMDIVVTSGYLFSFGSILVVTFHLFIPFNLAIFTLGIQSASLLLTRGVYFFLLYYAVFPVGRWVDFILIEIPTFIYTGLFFQILTVAYWLFFKSDESSGSVLIGCVTLALAVNWIIFAAILFTLTFYDSGPQEAKFCDCQLSDPVAQSHAAQYIRIIYISIVLIIAICVTILTLTFGRSHKTPGIRSEYHRVLGLSIGLLFDSSAFLLYYTLNTPSAYILVVLWITELAPVCVVNGMVASPYIRYWISERTGRLHDYIEYVSANSMYESM